MNGSCLRNVMITGKKSLSSAGPSARLPLMCTTGTAKAANTPEEVEEAERLYNHPDERPLQHDHDEYSSNEANCPTDLVLAREKVERLVRADDEGNARQEQDLGRRGVPPFSAAGTHRERRQGRRTFPSARSAPSKKSATPRKRKSAPNVVRATPISAAARSVSDVARRGSGIERRLDFDRP